MKAFFATASRIAVASATSVALLATVVDVAPAAATTRPSGPLVPATGALFGAYVDPDARWNGVEAAKAEVLQREAMLGRTLAVVQHYYSWTNTFPSGLEQWDLAGGRTPLVTWEPFGVTLDSIASGAQDDLIRARARGLRDLGAPVFLRWGHEMNGNWYSWSGATNGGGATGPAKYIAAYRRVHDVFRAEGASNVVFVWSPNHESVPNESWNHWTKYYPGDAYVDWVGPDGYNWGTTRSWSSWRSFDQVFRAVYNDYASRKPIMIAEVGSAEAGGSKGAWVASMQNAIKTTMPSIAAVVSFDVNKENDWRYDSSAGALAAYAAMGADAHFGGATTVPAQPAPVPTPTTPVPDVEPLEVTDAERTVTVKPSRKRIRKGRSVRLISRIKSESASCAIRQKVLLQTRRLGSGTYRTIRRATTSPDQTEAFVLRVYRTKTFRIVAPREGACKRAVSRAVRVRTAM